MSQYEKTLRVRASEETERIEWHTCMPTSMQDVRTLFVEGKNAFLPYLPRPDVHFMENQAYVSLTECVADLLAHGVELDNILAADFNDGPVTCISQTVRAKEIYNNACSVHSIDSFNDVVILFVNEWSGGFEPDYSIKGNRGSSWIKTVTICPPPGKIHSLTHMYPIAVGRS
jgi:hypothetical protein